MKDYIIGFFESYRFKPVWLLYLVLLVISFFTRVILLIHSKELDYSFINIIGIFAIGFLFDLINAGYLTIPCLLYLWLLPENSLRKSRHRYILISTFILFTFMLLLNAVAEFLFWNEFGTRFNFIAVDYLVYTTEVLGNIRQSYPVVWIIGGIGAVTFLIVYFLKDFLSSGAHRPVRFAERTLYAVLLFAIPGTSFFLVDTRFHNFSDDAIVNDLAGNGMYELFAAYRNNELDYDRFYSHIPDDEALRNVRKALGRNSDDVKDPNDFTVNHDVKSKFEEKRLNVVLISVESLSAEFMNLFGSKRNLTPSLDSLAKHSLAFTNLYATGTRTVRGLEAISLSVPPTPGQSIVRRPNNEQLFTLATVFNQKGYECKYIYGGYSYFDNMNYFFDNNGYKVVDRNSLSKDEIAYENVWGVADENLFSLSLREIDKTINSGRPVFAHIMTTSNHRPFTYPEGRIDIPSHTGREGAVKYTDYAIGKFIREASKRKWYGNTVFIITADHCASSAGKTELPIQKYLIPLLIFAPEHIAPGVEDRLMSQIDIAPTLLGFLNFSYSSKFYGYDMYTLNKGTERAFISTYQALGFIERDTLVVLKPGNVTEILAIGKDRKSIIRIAEKPDKFKIVKEAISWYQSASYSFKHGGMGQ